MDDKCWGCNALEAKLAKQTILLHKCKEEAMPHGNPQLKESILLGNARIVVDLENTIDALRTRLKEADAVINNPTTLNLILYREKYAALDLGQAIPEPERGGATTTSPDHVLVRREDLVWANAFITATRGSHQITAPQFDRLKVILRQEIAEPERK